MKNIKGTHLNRELPREKTPPDKGTPSILENNWWQRGCRGSGGGFLSTGLKAEGSWKGLGFGNRLFSVPHDSLFSGSSGDDRTPLTSTIARKIFWRFTLYRMIYRLKLHRHFLHFIAIAYLVIERAGEKNSRCHCELLWLYCERNSFLLFLRLWSAGGSGGDLNISPNTAISPNKMKSVSGMIA